ncbi:putative reverse transcriptase domain-containing protein [Tanacetum coccineum]
MAPKRATRSITPPETTTTTTVTNAQLQAMFDQGVTAALVARDANISTNGDDNHVSGTGVRRTERVARECTYPDFMKCQPLNFKGTKGVIELIQWFKKMETVFKMETVIVGNDIAYAMTWTELKKKMIDKYCPRTEIKKLEVELWELKISSKPKTMQEATEMAIEVMDKRIRTFADRTVEKKQYTGSKPLCSKCNYHHDGPCAPKCHKCNKVGHFAHDCRSTANANNANTQKCIGLGQKPTFYECGVQGHFKRECPKLKNNNNRGNQVGGGNAPAKVYTVGHAGTNPDSNVMTSTFLLTNRYAFVLFDTGADRSFVSTAFSS